MTETFLFENFDLHFDRIQADPFAPPSQLTIRIALKQTGFSPDFYLNQHRSTAFRDFLARTLARSIRKLTKGGGGSGNGGVWAINYGRQKILDRNSVAVEGEHLVVRLMAGLPGQGRKIDGRLAEEMLLRELPGLVQDALSWKSADQAGLQDVIHLADEQQFLRRQLREKDLLCFIADGSVLPRDSGVTDTPLPDAVPFVSPKELSCEMDLPDGKMIKGMGLPRGIVLITGGAYHGKSTLLRTIQDGIYDHIRGDGREYVVSSPDLVKVRAEDGRAVNNLDISPFIGELPGGKSTQAFNTENASGSTSQAAAIIEAMQMGCRCLLMDEDSSATNLLIRDRKMRALIPEKLEPVTPYLDLAVSLRDKKKVSTIIALGGNGDFLDIADTVIIMEEYRAVFGNEAASRVVKQYPRMSPDLEWKESGGYNRQVEDFDPSRRKRAVSVERTETGFELGKDRAELRYYEHITDVTQYDTLSYCLVYARQQGYFSKFDGLQPVMEKVIADIRESGWQVLYQGIYPHWNYCCQVRPMDIAAALNRLRKVKWVR